MEPTCNEGSVLTYQLGKYFSGRSRYNQLREQLFLNEFDIDKYGYVSPVEWHERPYPRVGELNGNRFWGEKLFFLKYAYLLDIPGIKVTKSTEDTGASVKLHITKIEGQGIPTHFIKTYVPADESRLKPYIRRIKDICDRL